MAGKLHQDSVGLAFCIAAYGLLGQRALISGLEEQTTVMCSWTAPGSLVEGLTGFLLTRAC